MTISEVRRDRVALVEALEAAGAVFRGHTCRCPFHGDGQASGSISGDDAGGWSYTCFACSWTKTGKRTGDILDIVQKTQGVDFREAAEMIGVEVGDGRQGRNGSPNANAGPPPNAGGNGRRSGQYAAAEAAGRLQGDGALLAKLWQDRAIDAETAARFRVGVSADRKYWTFATAVGLKLHRIDPATSPKCRWEPSGSSSAQVFPAGLDLQVDGVVWLCPGELKALAVIAVGRNAIAATGGEGAALPEALVEKLDGRQVAIVADDDAAGAKWAEASLGRLKDAGVDARVIDLGLSKADGLKDIGDLLQRRQIVEGIDGDELAAMLDRAWTASDPWASTSIGAIWTASETWSPVEHVPTGLMALDQGLGGLRCGGVHLLAGASGKGKTTTAVQIAINAARADFPVGVVSLEMSGKELGHLIAANLAGVDRRKVESGKLNTEEAARLRNAIDGFKSSLPISIIDDEFLDGPATRSRIEKVITAGVERFGWRLAILDYVGLLDPEEQDRSDYAGDCANSKMMKRLARRLDIAFLAIADIRKPPAKTNKKKTEERVVTLDDLRGASRLAYDAVTVFSVDSAQHPAKVGETPWGLVTMTALKTRFAGLGSRNETLEFQWHPECGRVENMTYE